MLKIGLTGGIGSGKSTVAQIFETLGIPVYYADERAKQLMVEEPELVKGIIALFGREAYHKDGSLNRSYIAKHAFSQPQLLNQLEKLVHPVVFEDGKRWQEAQQGVPYTLKEAALLFESGSHQDLDKVIVVTAPEEIRIERVMKRDQTTREAVEARIRQQMPEAEKVRLADFIIRNHGDHRLIDQVWKIHQQLLELEQVSKKQSHMKPTFHKFRLVPNEKEIKTFPAFEETLQKRGTQLQGLTFLALDLTQKEIEWAKLDVKGTTFIGCKLRLEDEVLLRTQGANFYIHPDGLPYDPYRSRLYKWQELMEGYAEENDQSTDFKIYHHFSRSKFNPPLNEALCQRIHDHAIDEALRDLLHYDGKGMTRLRCVGFMGGHSTPRTDAYFHKIAYTAKLLTENDYYVVSGGGPGIMEASNLGAYMAGKSNKELEEALDFLSQAPHYLDKGYHRVALEVLRRFPEGKDSLAIPTWFYGHEPSNLFASHIAKYFSNSLREDNLLAICLYGIIYAPGSAGTTQEIFQDATQNHYGTFNFYSPMIFMGKKRYELDTLIFPLLKQLSHGRDYHHMLHLTDEPEEVLRFLRENPPKTVEK